MQPMGSQRVGHDWATGLNWTELFLSVAPTATRCLRPKLPSRADLRMPVIGVGSSPPALQTGDCSSKSSDVTGRGWHQVEGGQEEGIRWPWSKYGDLTEILLHTSYSSGASTFKQQGGTSPAVQWLRLCAFTARGKALIPGWGTKIPQAAWPKSPQTTGS